jgi:hypothetical protein
MKFKLSQILESTILLEGRKEDTLKKYGEEKNHEIIAKEIIKCIVKNEIKNLSIKY